jgi:hypothetical protein
MTQIYWECGERMAGSILEINAIVHYDKKR